METIDGTGEEYVYTGKPNIAYLSDEWKEIVGDQGGYIAQCSTNNEVRYAEWAGQHEDGKKHGTAERPAFPWDGASDLKVYTADEAIGEVKDLLIAALDSGSLQAVPVEGNDLQRAKLVSSFMRWLVMTQIPHIDREIELAADYMGEKGLCATGQFWEKFQNQELDVLKLDQIAQVSPDIATALADTANDSMLVEMLAQAYPETSAAKRKTMVKELREKGETTVAIKGQIVNRPIIRAFAFDTDLFTPCGATDIENCPYIFRRQYMTPQQIREKVAAEDWDGDWAEEVIRTQLGKDGMTTDSSVAQSDSTVTGQVDDYENLVMVVWAYQKLSDEDGVPGVYETVFNPYVPELYAKHGLLGYRLGGEYPFVVHRREHTSRRLLDSRGLPQLLKPYQDQIKVEQDARIDNTSLATVPPMEYPIGRPPTQWGPGARIPTRRRQEYGYVERPPFPQASMEVERELQNKVAKIVGRPTSEEDADIARMKKQGMVKRWLKGWRDVFSQVWALYQQFGDEKVFFRVIGLKRADPIVFEKQSGVEKYDFYWNFDVLTMEPEKYLEKIKTFVEVLPLVDRNGKTDYDELTQVVGEAIDPIIAERIFVPKETATIKEVDEEQTELAKMSAGFDNNIKLGSNYELRMQVMQQWAQAPDVQQRLQQDEALRARTEKRLKQYQMQLQQQQNALIGRYGA